MIYTGNSLDVLRTMEEESVDCIVTSPPYFGLRAYFGGHDLIGLEKTRDTYIARLVDVFRECRRVLKSHGTFFLNIADSYAGSGKGRNGDGTDGGKAGAISGGNVGSMAGTIAKTSGQAQTKLNIPHRLLFALIEDGWLHRSTIIWRKQSCMPESVNGWRWEKCRVKTKAQGIDMNMKHAKDGRRNPVDSTKPNFVAQFKDCPGCPKCSENDGLVLRKGQWRPTSSHEYIFMLTKTGEYFCDREAVATTAKEVSKYGGRFGAGGIKEGRIRNDAEKPRNEWKAKANLRDVVTLKRGGFSAFDLGFDGVEHYATFPVSLPELCIKASTPEKGVCSKCGMPVVRVVSHKVAKPRQNDDYVVGSGRDDSNGGGSWVDSKTETLAFRPSCKCGAPAKPATCLDPFSGAGTTGVACALLGREYIGIDLSPEYNAVAEKRIELAKRGQVRPPKRRKAKGEMLW